MFSATFIISFLIAITVVQFGEIFLFENNRQKERRYADWSIFAFSGSYVLLIASSIVEYFLTDKKINFAVAAAGFVCIIARFLIKYWSIKSLGGFWSAHIRIKECHKLIRNGPYRFLRHPAYLARVIGVAGVALVMNAYYTLYIFLPLNLFLVFFRIKIEEKLLAEKFGNDFAGYKKETYKIIPLVF